MGIHWLGVFGVHGCAIGDYPVHVMMTSKVCPLLHVDTDMCCAKERETRRCVMIVIGCDVRKIIFVEIYVEVTE